MPQSVYTVGDPVTSRLKLGMAPDGSTTVVLTVRRPDGTAIATPAVSAWSGAGGDEKTAQFYATDDGTVGSPTGNAAGDWLVVWTVTGTGGSINPKVYGVQPLPTADTRASWTPLLSEVADSVPWLTLDTATPGGDTFLGTFTGTTYPTDEQAARHIRRVADPVAARWPNLPAALHDLARSYVAVRVAANLARAFPRTTADTAQADALDREADTLWTDLAGLAADAVTPGVDPSATGQVPIYAFPPPVLWGDTYL